MFVLRFFDIKIQPVLEDIIICPTYTHQDHD